MINVWYVALLSLAGAALLPAPRRSLSAAEESFVGRWVLDARHIEGRRVLDTSGRRPGSVLGPVRHGKAPAALVFDGKENRVVLAEDIGGLALPRRAITLEAWALVEETRDWTGLVGALQDNKGHEKGWLLGCRDDRFVFGLSTTGADDGDGKLTYIVSRTRLEPGYWYHVVGTYDGEVQALHVDGRLEASSRTQRGDILYPDEAPLVIGAYHDRDELHPFHGRIAEVAIDDRAHRASEIERRFRSRKSSFPEIDPVPPRPGWPTYRHDSRRTGYTPEELQLPLHLQWTHRARHAPRPAWPPPARRDIWHRKPRLKARVVFDRTFHVVCDAGRVTFGSSADGEVHCLDGRSGRELWSFSTEGPVRLAPTIADGKVLAGSDDGFLYALDAASGRLLWKHRPGPGPERLPGNGRLISLWPLRSSAVVSAGVVHICAGLFPEQGTYRSSLDLASGELLERQEIGVSPQGYLVRRGGRLYAPSGRAPEAFVTQMRRTGKASEEALGTLASGYPHELIGAGGLRFAGGDGQVAAFRASDAHLVWRGEVEGKAYSLAVADGRLLVSTDAGVIHCFAREEVEAPSTIDHRRPGDDAQVETDERSEKFFASAAERILQASGVTRGYCLVLGSGEGRLAREIARRSELQVVGVESDPAKVARSRRLLADAGLLERVAVHERSPGKTFYPDYIANLIVSETLLVSGRFPCPVNEVHRLLRPGGGIACLGHPEAVPAEAGGGEGRLARRDVERWLGERRGDARIETAGGLWTLLTRRPLDGVGEWTHLYADPGNTASSGDERVGGRLRLQWFGPPGPRQLVDRHHRTVAPLVKDGRLFVPGDERLIAVDAYNGALLWNVEVPGFRRLGAGRDCGNLALADDVLYAATGASCRALDVRTGRLAGSFELPAPPGVPAERSYDWGYLARLGDVLLGSGVRRGASRSRLSRETIGEVYYDARPLVTSDYLFALDRRSGERRWIYRPPAGVLVNPTIAAGGGRVYALESGDRETLERGSGRFLLETLVGKGAHLVALDLRSGEVRWRRQVDVRRVRHALYLLYARERLVLVGSRNDGKKLLYDLQCRDAQSGERLWRRQQDNGSGAGGNHGEQDLHPVVVGGMLCAEPHAYHLETGEPLEGWKWSLSRRSGCGTLSASARSLFFRHHNPTAFDIASGAYSRITRVSRPGCWINIIPASGLLLIPEGSSGCTCDFPLQTSMAFAPVSP